MTAGDLAGAHPWRSPALERTGAKVIAVERAGDVLVEFENGFTVRPDDVLFVCGSTNSLERYQREFQPAAAAAISLSGGCREATRDAQSKSQA
ncbi:MAG: hypothetical protein IPK39_13075 [Sulfuritalea sp.]|nr:hypothetical protein [Sulfuritalea sp.]